ncbi:hypothetical protein BGZ83_006080 [Gryganskiella cystojenkinii]|nr:hypothetical protein BGZ83_006080 [Gryganskiella cystojenkinii]
MNMRTLNPSASWTLSDDTHAVLREVLSSQMQTRHSLQQEKKSYKLKSLLPTGSSRSRPAPRSRKVAADEIQTLPLRRRSTLRRKGTGSNRTSELLRQRRQTTPKFARYLDMKPLPLVRSFSDAKRQQRHDQHVYQGLEPGQTEKPLPPIPQAFGVFRWDLDIETKTCIEEYNIPNKACIDGQGPSEQRVNHQQQNLSTYKEEMGESKMAITSLSEKSLVQENCESDHPQQPKGGITDRRNDSIEITPSAPQSVTNQDSQLVAITATIESPAEKEQQLPLPLFLSVDPNLDGPSSSSSTSSSSSHKRLDSFRFPLRKSPTERRIMARSKQHRHNHHHSLPYNSTRSHHTGKVMDANSLSPLDPLHHTRCSSTATTTSTGSDQDFITSDIIKALTGQTQKSQLYAHRCKESQGSTQEAEKKPGLAESSSSNSTTVTTERHHRRKGQQRLRRSESCGSSTLAHRPSLSFNSSKKELLSLQARRINKPDAKVLRLPEIQTNSAAMPIKTTAKPVIMIQDMAVANNENTTVVGPGSIVSSDSGVDATSTPSLGGASGSMVIKSGQISPSDMTDYQLQVSDKDRLAIDSILQELTTTDDTLQTGISSPTKALSTSAILTRPSSAIINAQLDVPQLPYHPDSTLSTPDTAGVGSTLDQTSASVMVSGPQTDATSESKRFVKRSHALRELVSTEMSYVNDLDILIHVHLKVLKSKSWFPLKIHTCLINCAAELLLTHRRFLTVLEGNIICAPERAQAPLSVYKTLAEAFETLCNDQDWYDDFCEHRMRTIKALNKYANATHLAVLQRESTDLMAQQNRPKVRADLKDLLIKPIQRVCRYPLLLKEVLRLTNIQDPEYAYVTDTHNRMRDLAHDLDETQKRVERKLLTEQFLKKLAETNLPKKYVFSAVAMGSAGSNGTDPHNSYSSHNGGEVLRVHPPQASMGGDNTTQANGGGSGGGGMAVHSPAGMSHGGDYFDHGLGADGVIPSPLTRAFVGSLGSILLAGALEFVLIPEIPIRLKYYGCFLFETMLLVVKAKKASLYEPRQWLPLRLCELQETTKLDGYTRFGWSLMFDQFRIDFGAKDEEEQEIWMRNLRIQIQAAKMAYAQLPIASPPALSASFFTLAFESIVALVRELVCTLITTADEYDVQFWTWLHDDVVFGP